MEPTARPSSDIRPRWYLIHCKPRQDARALENLERQGFTCYQPTLRVERLCDGRKVSKQEPLFPRYLFIQLDQVNDSWSPIRSTRGVSQIVRVDDHPVPVEDEIIEQIRQRLESDASAVPYLVSGDRVRIVQGPFSDLEAIFVASHGDQRVMLLLNILHHEQELSFPVASIRKWGGL